MPNMYARGILWGKMVLELGDTCTARNERNGYAADITFKTMTRVGPSFNDWALNINQRPKTLEDISPPLLFA